MINAFIKEIEETIFNSPIVVSSNIQKYFGPTKEEAYARGNLIFIDMSSLEFAIYIIGKGKKIIFDKYRFQYMDSKNRLVFRYDNAHHHKKISTFPHHKHLHDGKLTTATPPNFSELLEEITAIITQ